MEASGVAAGGQADGAGAPGAEGAAAEGQEGQQQAPGVDFSGLDDAIGKQLDQRFEQFGEQLGEQLSPLFEGEGEGEYDQGLEGFEGLDPGDYVGEDGEISPEAANAYLENMIEQRSQQAVEQAVGPLMERVTQMGDALNAQALVAKHPEFQQPEVAKATQDKVVQVGQQLGLQGDELAGFAVNPAMLELALQAGKAEQDASGVPAEGRSELGLESGAAAGQGSAQPNTARDIVGAGGGSSFWGVGG